MNPQKIKRSVEHLCERKVPIFLWGPPGIGKSSIIAQIAKEKGIACIDLRLSLLDPTDLRGIPFLMLLIKQLFGHQLLFYQMVVLKREFYF